MLYIQLAAFKWYQEFLQQAPAELRKVLANLLTLYGAWNLEKHLATFYIGKI